MKFGLKPLIAVLVLSACAFAQDAPSQPAANDFNSALSQPSSTSSFALRNKIGYYLVETYLNPSTFTAPAFRGAIRMASPPGKGAAQYPAEWRQGAEAFGRNYGDAFAERVSFDTLGS